MIGPRLSPPQGGSWIMYPQGSYAGVAPPQGAGGIAAPTLSYATSPLTVASGAAISMSPTATGSPTYAIQSGTAPTGTTVDAGTGVISGTAP